MSTNPNAIVIDIKANTDQMKTSLEAAEKRLNEFSQTMKQYGDTVQKVDGYVSSFWAKARDFTIGIQGFQYLKTAFSSLLSQFTQFGDSISKTSQRIGLSVETLGGLKFAAEQSGASFEDLTDAIKTFQEQLGAAKMGDTGAIDKLGAVGIQVKDFDYLSNEEQFKKLAEHIASIKSRSEQTRTAIEIFGEAGYKLLPMLQEGSVGIERLTAKAKELGLIMSEEAAQNAVELTDSLHRLQSLVSTITRNVFAVFADKIIVCVDGMQSFLQGIGQIPPEIQSVSQVLGTFTIVALGTAGAIGLLGKSFVVCTGAVKTFTLTMMSNPILAAITLSIAALTTAFIYFSSQARKATQAEKEKNAESSRTLKSERQLNSVYLEKMRRLEELNSIQNKTATQQKEAKRLADELRERYKGLNLEIDATTGKFKSLSGVYNDYIKATFQSERDALDDHVKELQTRARELQKHLKITSKEELIFLKGTLQGRISDYELNQKKRDEELLAGAPSPDKNAKKNAQVRKNQYLEDVKALNQLKELEASPKKIAEANAQRQKTLELEEALRKAESARLDAMSADEAIQLAFETRGKSAMDKELAEIDHRMKEQGKTLIEAAKGFEILRKEQGKLTRQQEEDWELLQNAAQNYLKQWDLMKADVRAKYSEQTQKQLAEMEKKFAEENQTAAEKQIAAVQKENEEYLKLLKTKKDLSKEDLAEARRLTNKREIKVIQSLRPKDEEILFSEQENTSRQLAMALSQAALNQNVMAIEEAQKALRENEKQQEELTLRNLQTALAKALEEHAQKEQNMYNTTDATEHVAASQEVQKAKERVISIQGQINTVTHNIASRVMQEKTHEPLTGGSFGTFSAWEAGNVGVGDVLSKQLKEQKTGTELLREMVREMRRTVNGLK